MITFILNKLGRDNTPEQMEKAGISCQFKIVTAQGLLASLQKKLIEESLEVAESKNRHEVVIELADVLEVMDSLKSFYAITQDEILHAKMCKYEEKGGFARGVFVESITMADDNPWVKHFRASPDRYKEKRGT